VNLSLNGPGLWYVTRATGIVTLLMLTFSVFLGVVTRSRRSTRRLPRFVMRRRSSTLAIPTTRSWPSTRSTRTTTDR